MGLLRRLEAARTRPVPGRADRRARPACRTGAGLAAAPAVLTAGPPGRAHPARRPPGPARGGDRHPGRRHPRDRRRPHPRRARPRAGRRRPRHVRAADGAAHPPGVGRPRARAGRGRRAAEPRTSRRSAARCAGTSSGSRASSGRRSTTSSAGCWSPSTTGGSRVEDVVGVVTAIEQARGGTQVFPQRQDHPADLEPLLAAVARRRRRHRRGRASPPAAKVLPVPALTRHVTLVIALLDTQQWLKDRARGADRPGRHRPRVLRHQRAAARADPEPRPCRRSTRPPRCSRRWRSARAGRCGAGASASCAAPSPRTTSPSRWQPPGERPAPLPARTGRDATAPGSAPPRSAARSGCCRSPAGPGAPPTCSRR